MLYLLLISLGTDETIIRTANIKQKEEKEKIIYKNINMIILSEDHDGFLNNVEIALNEKTDASDPERREEFWKTKLRQLTPLGLNVEE